MNYQKSTRVALIAFLMSFAFLAWSPRPAFNRVASTTLTVSGSSLVPPYYTGYLPGFPASLGRKTTTGSSVQSMILSGLGGKNYSHISIVNNTKSKLSLVSTDTTNPLTVPASNSSQKIYVLSSAAGTFDDISVFDALFLQSETGASVTEGSVDVMVW